VLALFDPKSLVEIGSVIISRHEIDLKQRLIIENTTPNRTEGVSR
jgi:hypothetical protein